MWDVATPHAPPLPTLPQENNGRWAEPATAILGWAARLRALPAPHCSTLALPDATCPGNALLGVPGMSWRQILRVWL